jgi:putative endonuclease
MRFPFFKKASLADTKTDVRTTEKSALGALGENAAIEYLLSQGYKLLERNWRHSHSEIDAIMTDGWCVVFCEVRTQDLAREHYLTPSESVTRQKRESLCRGATYYLANFNKINKRYSPLTPPCRFDIIEVYVSNGKAVRTEHIKNAFYMTRKRSKGKVLK